MYIVQPNLVHLNIVGLAFLWPNHMKRRLIPEWKRKLKSLRLCFITGPHDQWSQSFLVALVHVTCKRCLSLCPQQLAARCPCSNQAAGSPYSSQLLANPAAAKLLAIPSSILATLTSQSAAVGLTMQVCLPPQSSCILSTWDGTIGSWALQPPIIWGSWEQNSLWLPGLPCGCGYTPQHQHS